MSIESLLYSIFGYSVQFALLVGLAFIAAFLTRIKHPFPTLYFWQSILGLSLILPVLDSVLNFSPPVFDPVFQYQIESSASTVPASDNFSYWAPLLLSVLSAGNIFNLGRLMLGFSRLRILRGKASLLDPEPDNLAQLRDRLYKQCVVKVSREIEVPLTFGLLHPVILVPEKFRLLDKEQQECIICHELLHISRRDWLLNLSEQIIKSLLWFHPAIYFLIKEINLSREKLIDARVVGITGKRNVYLNALWRMIQPGAAENLYPVVPFAGRSHLLKRVKFLSIEDKITRRLFRRQSIAAAMSFLLVMILTVSGGHSVSPIGLEKVFVGTTESTSNENDVPDNSSEKPDGQPLRLSAAEASTLLLKRVNPVYPKDAKMSGISGVVRCSVRIDRMGKVKDITVIRSPDRVLSDASVEALKQWVYEPTLKDGEPVEVSSIVTFFFAPQ
jgi:TonB family protein